MAISKVKGTYSLDADTIALLERISRRWSVSKSEALRRAIQAAARLPAQPGHATRALDRLQQSAALSETTAAAWQRRVRSERRNSARG